MTRLLQTFKNAGRATAAHTTRTIPRQIRDRNVDKDDADDKQHDERDECDEWEECDEEARGITAAATQDTDKKQVAGRRRRLVATLGGEQVEEGEQGGPRRAMRERQHGACEHSRWRAANAMGHAGLLS